MQKLIDDMIDTMHEYHGVGLAAPQIHEGLRIFVAAIAPDDEEPLSPDDEPMVFINPVITRLAPEIVEDWEGASAYPTSAAGCRGARDQGDTRWTARAAKSTSSLTIFRRA